MVLTLIHFFPRGLSFDLIALLSCVTLSVSVLFIDLGSELLNFCCFRFFPPYIINFSSAPRTVMRFRRKPFIMIASSVLSICAGETFFGSWRGIKVPLVSLCLACDRLSCGIANERKKSTTGNESEWWNRKKYSEWHKRLSSSIFWVHENANKKGNWRFLLRILIYGRNSVKFKRKVSKLGQSIFRT